jgi:DNA-binding CsgD family transcriptional regulator
MTPFTHEEFDTERLLGLLDSIGVAVYARDADGRVLWANASARTLPEPSLPEVNGHVIVGHAELVDRDGRRWLTRSGSTSGIVLGVALPYGTRAGEAGLSLTKRQEQVLRLLAAGRETEAIAAELGIALETARNHIRALLKRLDAHSRLEAVVRATRAGLLDLNDDLAAG